jgi:uncharacterized protein (UPF0248 family)/sugar phosphate isomerase/epimerase
MTNARDILNKLIWDKRFDIGNYAIVFVHRGAPHDLKAVKASAVSKVEKSFFIMEEETMIPFHRIRAIRDLRSGDDIYTKDEGVPFSLQEIEGHEGLGEFQDKAHSPRLVESSRVGGGEIRCGARLSFPEDDAESFRKRAMDGAKSFKMVELSFFGYSGNPEESERYKSIMEFTGKVIADTCLNVGSLHLPNINILHRSGTREMLDTFLPFCTQAGCSSIVVHPGILDVQHSYGTDRDQARSHLAAMLREESGELDKAGVTLSIETYPEKNRVPSGALDIHDFVSSLTSSYRVAYDTSHTMGDTDSVIKDILHNIEKIRVFHFSNRNKDERHMPIFSSKGDLSFAKIISAVKSSCFSGMIILEYQPKKYRMLLEHDLRLLENMINQS